MLSRVAETLYWIGRYVERAEDSARLLDVHYHALLDAQVADHGESWQRIVALYGDESAYREHYDEYTAQDVAEWVLWHDGNPSAVAGCITLARENARSVREQISGEMWEAINSLFLVVGRANRRAAVRGPHAFFEELRQRSAPLPGHRRRDDDARRAVRVPPARPAPRARGDDRAGRPRALPDRRRASRTTTRCAPHELIALLKSCSAFEAYVRRYGASFEPLAIAEELIRSAAFPRAVLYCLRTCATSVDRIAGPAGTPQRVLGRLGADLEYGEVDDVSGAGVAATLLELLAGINRAGDAVAKAFFSTRAVPAAALASQEDTAAAMWLTVEHITRYGYDAPINEAYTELRLKPLHRDGQRCSSFVLATEPRGATVDEYLDRYGNTVHHFDLLEVHESLSVTVRSEVWTTAAYEAEEPTLSPLDRWDYPRPDALRRSRRPGDRGGRRHGNARRPGRGSLGADARRSRRDDVRARDDERAHHRGRGARRRARGLPGLRPRDDRRLPGSRHPCALRQRLPVRHRAPNGGEGESHAWVDVHVGDTWISLDPTHDTHRPSATSASASAATTPTSRPRAASTAAPRPRRSRSRSRSASRSADASSSTGSARSSAVEPAVEVPSRPVGLADRVRDRAHLDGRHARALGRAQHAEALHRLDEGRFRPIVASASDRRRRVDREAPARGQSGADGLHERGVRRDAVDDRPLGRQVAVDGLRADHERPDVEPPRPRPGRRGAPPRTTGARVPGRSPRPPRPGRRRRRARRLRESSRSVAATTRMFDKAPRGSGIDAILRGCAGASATHAPLCAAEPRLDGASTPRASSSASSRLSEAPRARAAACSSGPPIAPPAPRSARAAAARRA